MPDFDIVRGGDVEGGKQTVPPFFVVEVEELPRRAGIEWHAHVGVTNGPVQVSHLTSP